jgi:hypothetical protein
LLLAAELSTTAVSGFSTVSPDWAAASKHNKKNSAKRKKVIFFKKRSLI